jgi:hypothetical protein
MGRMHEKGIPKLFHQFKTEGCKTPWPPFANYSRASFAEVIKYRMANMVK